MGAGAVVHTKRGKRETTGANHRHLSPKVRIGKAGEGIINHTHLTFSPSAFFLRHHCLLIYSVHIYIHIPSFLALLLPLLQAIVYAAATRCLTTDIPSHLVPCAAQPPRQPRPSLHITPASASQGLPCVHPQSDDIASFDPIATSYFHFTIQSAAPRARNEPLPLPTLLRA